MSSTKTFFDSRKIHPTKIRRLDDLFVSALAVGTYLGNHDDATDRLYEQALVSAVLNGVNFFESAACLNILCDQLIYSNRTGICRQRNSQKSKPIPTPSIPMRFATYAI